MPASEAQSTVRLPRQVLRRSAEIQAHLDAQRATPETGQPPAVDTPPTPPAEPNPPVPAVDPRESDPAYWKHRFEVTSGYLRRERQERAAEADGYLQQIAGLQGQVQTLQTQLDSKAPAEQIDLSAFYTPEQIEQLGEDECRAMAATALKAAQNTVRRSLDAELKPLRERQAADEDRRARTAQQAFLDALAEWVPDWQTIDESDDFKVWLAQEDESSGMERQQLMDAHVGRGDAKKVANLFKAYKASIARPLPPVTPAGTGAVPQSEIRSQPALTPPTTKEIKDYYKRAALKQVSNEERTVFEARRKLLK